MLLLILIVISVLAAIASLLVKKNTFILEGVAVVAGVAEAITVFLVSSLVVKQSVYSTNAYLSVDALSTFILIIIATIGLIALLYSISYLRQEVAKGIIGFHRVRQYYVLLHLFLAAMFAAVISTNPIVMWIAIEATTLSTAFLISFYNKPSATEAAWKYLIINSVGLMLCFFGTLLFLVPTLSVAESHAFASWETIITNVSQLNPFVIKVAFVFILVGYGTKMGLVPMHTWLPDAHSKAPVPISGLLSGVLLNVAFFAILRFKLITDKAVGVEFTQSLLIFFGVISILIAAFIIFVQKNYKRLLAYSSIEHMGIAALGFGFGGLGVFAALLHMLYHSLTKSMLFLSSGNIFLKYSSTKIANVRGTLSIIPVTSGIFIIGFLSITGVPPFGIFLTETYILSAGITNHPIVVLVALLSFVLVFAGFLKHVTAMVFSERPKEVSPGEARTGTLVPLITLVAILLFLGFFIPQPIMSIINSAASMY